VEGAPSWLNDWRKPSLTFSHSQQANFTFYRPAALTLASTIADAPFNMLQILIFSIIVYFMAGLASGAGAFFSVRLASGCGL
jgi:ABC-type multidrug transport system permease subunit